VGAEAAPSPRFELSQFVVDHGQELRRPSTVTVPESAVPSDDRVKGPLLGSAAPSGELQASRSDPDPLQVVECRPGRVDFPSSRVSQKILELSPDACGTQATIQGLSTESSPRLHSLAA